jgi:hypothetical protein
MKNFCKLCKESGVFVGMRSGWEQQIRRERRTQEETSGADPRNSIDGEAGNIHNSHTSRSVRG